MSAADKGPYERHVFIPDLHAPYHDRAAVAVALAFIRHFRADKVWILGDALDFYQLSRFDKEPRRALELQADIDCAHDLLAEFRRAAPQADIALVRGNHEDRLRRYLWTKAAELSGLRGLTVPELLRLADLRTSYIESGQQRIADFIVKHGTLVRARSGYTATGELDKAGLSGVSGHTHRLGHVVRHTEAGTVAWIEAGCLCDLHPEYLMGNTADWAHGLAYGYMERRGNRFGVNMMPIVNGRVIFDGREITAKRR